MTDNPPEGGLGFAVSLEKVEGSIGIMLLVLGIIEWRCATILRAGCVCATMCG